jgi:hypothetical protein
MKLNDPNVHFELAKEISRQKKMDPSSIVCKAKSIVFEPTGSEDGYMFGKPVEVDECFEEFAAVGTKVVPCPAVKVCKECCNNQQHKFLAAEGVKQCAMCNHDLCQFCVWMEEGGEAMCFECKQQNLVVEDVSMGEDNLSEQEMRRYLRIECNANLPAVASFTQVLTLYQQYKRQLLFLTAISNVK